MLSWPKGLGWRRFAHARAAVRRFLPSLVLSSIHPGKSSGPRRSDAPVFLAAARTGFAPAPFRLTTGCSPLELPGRLTMAQVGLEPTAFEILSLDGRPIAYRAEKRPAGW